MRYQALTAVWIAIILWSSAFVAIRAALQAFSPGGLALLRYIVASVVMGVVYYFLKDKKKPCLSDIVRLLILGAVGVGLYNIFLNYGELSISSGVSSFIVSQSPLLSAIFAVIFLEETLTRARLLGFLLSIVGIAIMSYSELNQSAAWSLDLLFIFLATVISAIYSIAQKPLLKSAHPIEATTYIIWGAALFLVIYTPTLSHDLSQVSYSAMSTVIYLGIFPGALGYIMWSYALIHMPTGEVVSYLYFSPFISTLIGWLWLSETPTIASLIGGIVAMVGVYLINRSYSKHIIVKRDSR